MTTKERSTTYKMLDTVETATGKTIGAVGSVALEGLIMTGALGKIAYDQSAGRVVKALGFGRGDREAKIAYQPRPSYDYMGQPRFIRRGPAVLSASEWLHDSLPNDE